MLSPLQAVVISIFGQGSIRPRRTALIRISILVIGCAAISGVLTRLIMTSALLQPFPNAQIMFFPGLIAMQALILASLLTAHGVLHPRDNDSLGRWLVSLPLPAYRLQGLLVLPKILCVGFACLLAAPPIVAALTQLGLSTAASVLAIAGGSLTALAFEQVTTTWPQWLRLASCGILVISEYLLSTVINNPLATPSDQYVAYGIWVVGLSLVVMRALCRRPTSAACSRSRQRKSLHPRWWVLCKILRSSGMQASWLAAFGLSAAIAYASQHFGLYDTPTLTATAATLGGAVTADSRMLYRRLRPVEIAGLQGTSIYWLRLNTAVTLHAIASVTPLLWLMAHAHHLTLQVLLGVITGCVAGICASTVVTPTPRNVSAQCLAVLLCLALTLSYNSFFPPHSLGYLCAIVTLLSISIVIEYKRNPYSWRFFL